MKTPADYNKEVQENLNNPNELARIQMECAGWFAYWQEQYAMIKIKKAGEWVKLKKSGGDKMLSDSMTDALWEMTEDGVKEIKIKATLKSLEKIIKAVQTSTVIASQDKKYSGLA